MSIIKKLFIVSLLAIIAAPLFASTLRAQAGSLTPEEAAGILYMREEEKLARDVYINLYKKWGLQNFQNISQAEQNHMDAVKTLIDRYGLQDPASNRIGVFTNAHLQALYDGLIARGSLSPTEALKVGGAIEEIDILDLRIYIAQTAKYDIQKVYTNLANGSCNHLCSFVSTLSAKFGETYQPQYMAVQDYQAIIAGCQIGGKGPR